MRFGWLIAGWLIVTASTGCRNRAAQELLERDLRLQEDRIYELEDQLGSLLAENEGLRHSFDYGTTTHVAPLRSTSPSTSRPLGVPATGNPATTLPPPTSTTPPSTSGPPVDIPLVPPRVEFQGTGHVPEFRGPPAIMRPGEHFAEGEPARSPLRSAAFQGTVDGGPAVAAPLNAYVSNEDVDSISLHEKRTIAYDDDGQPGDDGIRLVIEPRNDRSQILAAPARVSIVLMDPMQRGSAARLERWDFDAEQAAAAYNKTSGSEGLHFELPWTNALPRNSQLHLFVRYYTDDQRTLETNREIEIRPRPYQDRRFAQSGTVPFGHPAPPQPTTRRSPQNGPYAPPTARLLPPEFQTRPAPLDPRYATQQPTLAPPSAPAEAAPPAVVPPRKRTGAVWTPYR